MLLKMDSYASVLEIVRVVAMVERCHVRSLSYLSEVSRSEFIDKSLWVILVITTYIHYLVIV